MAKAPDIRYTKFLEVLPRNKYNITQSARDAGFSEHTARTQQKRIMANALKVKANQIIEQVSPSTPMLEQKKTMSELVGISKQSLMDNIRFLAEQERDLATRLKVVKALSREYQVDLGDEETTKVSVPVLNITMKQPENQGYIEPHAE